MKDDMRLSRRRALMAGATIAAGAAAVGGIAGDADAQDLRRFDRQPAIDAKHRILLKGGTIISMDAKVGDLAKGDVLVEGSKIAAIAPEIHGRGRAGDRRGKFDHHAGTGRLPSPLLGSAASPHQSQFADACGLLECDTSVVRQVLSAAGSLRRQLSDRRGLHRLRHHLRDRQFAQFPQRRPFRRGGRGADRRWHTCRARFRPAGRRRLGLTNGRRISSGCRRNIFPPPTSF